MTRILQLAAALSTVAVAISPYAATAQVQGIATADTVQAVAQTKAFASAFQQIQTQYQNFNTQIQTKLTELNSLNAKLDTNGDKIVNQQEMDNAKRSKNPVLTQIDAKNKEIQGLRAPIDKARIYAIEQITAQYGAAQNNVIKSKKISIMLAPDAFVYAPEAVNVSSAITAELDRLIPAAAIAPPPNWNPQRQSVALYRQIEQLISLSARAQASQAAQQPAAAQAGSR